MAPISVSKPGAVLPEDAALWLDGHSFPGLPGAWYPGVPISFQQLGVADAVDAFKAQAALAGAPLVYDDFDFQVDPGPSPEPDERLKAKVVELLELATAAGVPADQVAALSKSGVSKQSILDAIDAAGSPDLKE